MRGFSKLKNNLKYWVVEEGLIVILLNVIKQNKKKGVLEGRNTTWAQRTRW